MNEIEAGLMFATKHAVNQEIEALKDDMDALQRRIVELERALLALPHPESVGDRR